VQGVGFKIWSLKFGGFGFWVLGLGFWLCEFWVWVKYHELCVINYALRVMRDGFRIRSLEFRG